MRERGRRRLQFIALVAFALLALLAGLEFPVRGTYDPYKPIAPPSALKVESPGASYSLGGIHLVPTLDGGGPALVVFLLEETGGLSRLQIREYSVPSLQLAREETFPLPQEPRSLGRSLVEDLDGDGDHEMVVVGVQKSATLPLVALLHFSAPALTDFRADNCTYGAATATDVIAADLDEDGVKEVIVAGSTDDVIRESYLQIFRYTGGGLVSAQCISSSIPIGGHSAAVAAGDIDADGDLEIVWTYSGNSGAYDSTKVEVLQMDGLNETLSQWSVFQFGDGNPFDLLLLNGDSDSDLEAYLATDAGYFGPVGMTRWQVTRDTLIEDARVSLATEMGYAHRAEAFDFGGDGRPEILLATTTVNASTNSTIAILSPNLDVLGRLTDPELGDVLQIIAAPATVDGRTYVIAGGSREGVAYIRVWGLPGPPSPSLLPFPIGVALAGGLGIAAAREPLLRRALPAFVPLGARVASSEAMRNGRRRRIYEYVTASGGVTEAMVYNDLKLPRATTRYHLDLLVRLERLAKTAVPFDGERTLYTLPGVTVTLEDCGRLTRARVLLAFQPGGVTSSEVAEALGISGALARYHLRSLAQEGAIRKEGRRYFLNPPPPPQNGVPPLS